LLLGVLRICSFEEKCADLLLAEAAARAGGGHSDRGAGAAGGRHAETATGPVPSSMMETVI